MNKYEMLHEVTKENILSTLKSSNVSKMKISFIKDELTNYNELVERATPKKIKRVPYDYFIVHHCSNCDSELEYKNQQYCDACGQALDWTD